MPEARLKLLPAAWTDLDQISDYYLGTVGPAAAQRITDQLLDMLEVLEAYPLSGPPHPDPELAVKGYRKPVLSDTYVAAYKAEDNATFVYRIVNGKTDYPKLFK